MDRSLLAGCFCLSLLSSVFFTTIAHAIEPDALEKFAALVSTFEQEPQCVESEEQGISTVVCRGAHQSEYTLIEEKNPASGEISIAITMSTVRRQTPPHDFGRERPLRVTPASTPAPTPQPRINPSLYIPRQAPDLSF